jgi:hypothetical protein
MRSRMGCSSRSPSSSLPAARCTAVGCLERDVALRIDRRAELQDCLATVASASVAARHCHSGRCYENLRVAPLGASSSPASRHLEASGFSPLRRRASRSAEPGRGPLGAVPGRRRHPLQRAKSLTTKPRPRTAPLRRDGRCGAIFPRIFVKPSSALGDLQHPKYPRPSLSTASGAGRPSPEAAWRPPGLAQPRRRMQTPLLRGARQGEQTAARCSWHRPRICQPRQAGRR